MFAGLLVLVAGALIVGALVRSADNVAGPASAPTGRARVPVSPPTVVPPPDRTDPDLAALARPTIIPAPVAAAQRAPTRAGTVMDSGRASALVSELVRIRNTARNRFDLVALRKIDRDLSLFYDEHNCDCISVTSDAQHGKMVAVMPLVVPDADFPSHFMAEVHFTGRLGTYTQIVVVARDSAEDLWRIAFDATSQYATSDPHAAFIAVGRLQSGGWAEPFVGTGEAGANLDALAQQWTSFKEKGRGESSLGFHADEGERFGDHKQDALRDNNYRGYYSFTVDESVPVYRFALNRDRTIECGAIRIDVTWKPVRRDVPFDPGHEEWGDLEYGYYDTVLDRRKVPVCVTTEPLSDTPYKVVIGGDEIYDEPLGLDTY